VSISNLVFREGSEVKLNGNQMWRRRMEAGVVATDWSKANLKL
jgi:hypothetical protein